MTIKLGYLAPFLLVAAPLGACTKEQAQSVSWALKGVGIEDTITVQELEDVPEVPVVKEPCVVGPLWRTHFCSEGGVLTEHP